ncbi:MAG: phage baseplate assembly protein V [Devosia sp.]
MGYRSTMGGWFETISARMDEVERRARNKKRTGIVDEIDHAKGLARVSLGGTMRSPWVPWQEIAAGGIKSHIPPSIGEQVDLISENGDLTDAVISMSTPSNANPRPHAGPEAVITYGASRLEIGDGVVTITADLVVNGSLSVVGAAVTHNGTNIGDTHVHGGVQPGGADTAVPH